MIGGEVPRDTIASCPIEFGGVPERLGWKGAVAPWFWSDVLGRGFGSPGRPSA
jgi:hypothetical protein